MDFVDNGNHHILICCSASVATIKLPKIVEKLTILSRKSSTTKKIDVRVVCTDKSRHFFEPDLLPVTLYTDQDEWSCWQKMGDPVLHIELRRWADIMVIAPLDANTLAKMAAGICDNLLTCIVRAWDTSKPLLFAPAMNTHMWNHPHTAEHINKLKQLGYTEIPCVNKKLACGDEGYGGMAEVDTIISQILTTLNIPIPQDSTTISTQ